MEVIRMPLTDQVLPVPNIRTRTFFIVRECLDDTALRNALTRLIRDHWRKLGARIFSSGKSGLLEYRLPRTFADSYELFVWSSAEYDHSIDKVLSPLKPRDQGVTFMPSMTEVEGWFCPSSWARHMSETSSDSPMLHVHLSHFSNATVLALNVPHVLGDQLGTANLMKAWLGLVEGREPPPMAGYDEDILPGQKPYADVIDRKESRKGKLHIRRPLEYAFVILPFMPEFLFRKEVQHIVFFPLPLIQSLREKHARILAETHKDFTRISDGDILTAILTKFHRMHDKKIRTISLSQTVNLRGRVSRLSGPDSDGYIHNALHFASARFRIGSSTSLGEIAWRNRQAIDEALQESEIEAGLTVARELVRRGQNMHICEPFERSYSIISWCTAWRDSGEPKTPRRYATTIMTKSDEGYWCDFSASEKAMKLIHEYLAKDPLLERF
ncbi:hypothetical protein VTK73DRAFT_981 [Phialemonium thermophilum]|uniref:Uncharacterized protein n=1 Tax=Phialemonium thermophilum TaxID=223376 RepID=A0ABR3XBZ4_9PEZI